MTGDKKPDVTPQGNAPSWVDEVLSSSKAGPAPAPPSAPLAGPADLKLPGAPPRPPAPPAPPASSDDWVARATGGAARAPQMPSGPDVTPRPTQGTSEVLSDFMRPIVNELNGRHEPQAAPAARVQTADPVVDPAPAQARPVDAWGDPAQQPAPYRPPPQVYRQGDVSQKKLIAGLLAIFLGGLGVHKFYLGMNNPGLIMLGVTVGAWILGVLTLIIGIGFLIVLIPSLVGLLGLIEGILYLTKSDADFERDYLIGKKPWL